MRAPKLVDTRRFREAATPTQLYFVETMCAERHIKVGIAANVRARMNKMQMNCPYTLRLLKRVADSAELERQIHARFDHLRIAGEWFRRSADLEDYIATLDGSIYLEIDDSTRPEGWTRFKPFPADARTVRTTEVRLGVRPAAMFREVQP